MAQSEFPASHAENRSLFLSDECIKLSKITARIEAINRDKQHAYDESIMRAEATIALLRQRIAHIRSIAVKAM
ncbi:hypothetical protein FACS189487_09980 [Campylobacterota bacterium]|nr:hypothetical protein FACS189487_09980 [Campylobacterota bacterium]